MPLQLKVVSDIIKASIHFLTLFFGRSFPSFFITLFLFAILAAGFVQGHHNTFANAQNELRILFCFFLHFHIKR